MGTLAHRTEPVGDAMNVTARLAYVAAAGEILITTMAASAASVDPTLERRSLQLKGRTAPIDVVRLQIPT
jgi:class 3 adenylate cyclase